MTLTPAQNRPSDHTILVILVDWLAQQDLISAIPGPLYDWVEGVYADHGTSLDSLLDSAPLADPVERRDP